jgi:hypothetical protein
MSEIEMIKGHDSSYIANNSITFMNGITKTAFEYVVSKARWVN